MTHVQIAIDDQQYAQAVAHLLEDGEHFVHVVDKPSAAIHGVILADEAHLEALWPSRDQLNRCLFLAHSPQFAPSSTPGLRHLAFRCDPPFVTCLAVLAAELRLTNDNVRGVKYTNQRNH